mgnify:CR=1 FL=1
MKKLILYILFIFVISCSTNDKDDYKNDQSLYENNSLKDYEIFKLANDYVTDYQYELALIELDKIEVLYPNSPYASKSILVRAYIYFLKKDYEKTQSFS